MRHIVLLICYCFVLSVAYAQSVDISVPLEGAVFQQDGTGFGNLTVQGNFNSVAYSQSYTNLIAEVHALTPQDAVPMAQQPTYQFTLTRTGTAFSGSMRVATGWYYLLIKGLTNEPQPRFIGLQSLPRKVGVGEVFIIAGQSNAQGLAVLLKEDDVDPLKPRIQYDDVNVGHGVRYPDGLSYDAVRVQPWAFDPNVFNTLITDPSRITEYDGFTAINRFLMGNLVSAPASSRQGIAPTGASLWYWARLGERLIDHFGVPVAFFNAAWGGTQIKAWAQSTDVTSSPLAYPAINPATNQFYRYPAGQPYRNLRATLRSRGGIYGARAVLWLQGETDVQAIQDKIDPNAPNDLNAGWRDRAVNSPADYRDNLHQVIRQTRQDFGPVPWVIGKTSIIRGIDPNTPEAKVVEDGQALAISSAAALGLNQVFPGPNMNTAVTARRTPAVQPQYGTEPVHFFRKGPDNPTDGLVQAADAWYSVLESLLANGSMQPVTPTAIGTDPRPLRIDPANGMVTVMGPPAARVYWVADNNGTFDLEQPVGYGASVSSSSSGRKRAVLVDERGNYTITQAVNFPYTLVDDTGTPPSSGPSCYEAETGSRSAGADVQAGGNASGGQYVGGFDGASRYVDFAVNVAAAGAYPLTFYTASAESGGNLFYSVNGGGTTQFGLALTGAWNQFQPNGPVTVNLQAGANTIRVQGGFRFTLDKICVGGSGNTQPACNFSVSASSSTASPSCGQSLQLFTNCSSGDCSGLTYAWSGNGLSSAQQNPTFTVPASNGNYTYTVTASKAGCQSTAQTTLTVSGCGGGGSFAFNPPQFDCGSGQVTLSVSNGNGNPVEYRAPGLQDWSANNTLTIPTWQRNGTMFSFQARQSGNPDVSTTLTTSCAGYRLGVAEPVEESGLVISPNPATGRVWVRFRLGVGERGQVSVFSLAGRALQQRSVMGTGQMQEEVLNLEHEAAGQYVIRVQGESRTQTGRVLLVR